MRTIENCCAEIKEVAEKNWMTAYVTRVGYREPVIKICPEISPDTPLLVLRHQVFLYLVQHRNSTLTSIYKDRRVSLEWVTSFIKANFEERNKAPGGCSSFFDGFSGDDAGDWRDWKR